MRTMLSEQVLRKPQRGRIRDIIVSRAFVNGKYGEKYLTATFFFDKKTIIKTL